VAPDAPSLVFEGGCHCGAIAFEYRPTQPPAGWAVRACQCRFCRAHGARTTSDPEGAIAFRVDDESQLRKYRFGSRTADFYVCRSCGVYVAAVLTTPRGRFATVNINTLRDVVAMPDAAPVSYDAESAEAKQARREQRWTPVVDHLKK
jgi:hypothetical protein